MYTWKVYGGCPRHRTWGVYFPNGKLVSVCVYRRGAIALCNLLNNYAREIAGACAESNQPQK